MRKAAGYWFLILFLAAAGYVALQIQTLSLASLRSYSKPARPVSPAQAGNSRPISPLSGSVLLVVVGGLPEDSSWRLGALQMLRSKGASAVLKAEPPGYAPAAWLTLLSGATAETHGALFPAINPDPIPDNILTQAQVATLYTALAAPEAFLAVADPAGNAGIVEKLPPQASTAPEALETIKRLWKTNPSLMVVYLPDLDFLGHLSGTRSQEFREGLARVDAALVQILEAVDLRRSTIIVTSDFGRLINGHHGGSEPEAQRVPLVAAGRGIMAGTRGEFRQKDLAPTIATILGLPFPELSEGLPATSLLDIGQATGLVLAERLAQLQARQRSRIESLWLAVPHPPSKPAAPVSLEEGLAGARNLEHALERARESARRADSWERLAPAGGAATVSLVTILVTLFTKRHRRAVIIGALVYLALFNLLLMGPWRFGPFSPEHSLGYSLSSLDPHGSLIDLGRQRLLEAALAATAASMVAGFLAGRTAAEGDKKDRLRSGKAGLWMAAFTTAILGLPAAWVYLIDGLIYTRYLPDLDRLWVLHLALLQVMVLGSGGIIWALVASQASRLRSRDYR